MQRTWSEYPQNFSSLLAADGALPRAGREMKEENEDLLLNFKVAPPRRREGEGESGRRKQTRRAFEVGRDHPHIGGLARSLRRIHCLGK